jgi:hypothetical protein
VRAVFGHLLGHAVAEAVADGRDAGRELERDLDVAVLLLDLVVAPVAAVALERVLLDVAPVRPGDLPAGDFLELAEVLRRRQLAREEDRVRRTDVDDGARVVERGLLVVERVRLLVAPHVEDFGEVLAAGIAGDAQLRIDAERSGGVDGLLDRGGFSHRWNTRWT